MAWVVDEIAEMDPEFARNARSFYARNIAVIEQEEAKKQIIGSSITAGVSALIVAAGVYGYNFCNSLEDSNLACWGPVASVCAGVVGGIVVLGGLLFLAEGVAKYRSAEKVYRRETRGR